MDDAQKSVKNTVDTLCFLGFDLIISTIQLGWCYHLKVTTEWVKLLSEEVYISLTCFI